MNNILKELSLPKNKKKTSYTFPAWFTLLSCGAEKGCSYIYLYIHSASAM